MSRNKLFILVSAVIVASMLLAACAPQVVEKTVVVTQEVMVEGTPQIVETVITATPEPVEEQPAFLAADGMVACNPLPEMALSHETVASTAPAMATAAAEVFGAPQAAPAAQTGKVYRVGVFEDVTTLNLSAANGPDNTVWNSYMLPQRLSMFQLTDKTFSFAPFAAAEAPTPLVEENGKWVTTIKMREDITWCDGTPFTAADVAFTANAVLGIGLIGGYSVLTVRVSPEATEITLGPLGIDTAVLAIYFIFGLTLAVGAHEYFHGIQIFSEKLKLDFIGLVFLVIPIEPSSSPGTKSSRPRGSRGE